ncbi:MAG: VWA domain-containing protein [Propionibacteriaceae bacterium]|nr:VWA domain-containing protein [Propionibacteriaceae bacterium]
MLNTHKRAVSTHPKHPHHLIIASSVALFCGAFLPSLAAPAQAAVPTPGSDTSVITVEVGGTRTSTTAIAPLQGITLELFDGSSATQPTSASTPLTDSWAVCTSDADGDCSFTIPNTGIGGANRDRRFYIQQSKTAPVPAGWHAIPEMVTSMDGNSFTQIPYAIHTGTQLRGGQVYTSTASFMVTGTGVQASTGIWPQALDNPPLRHACGVNVALILDLSYSVQIASALPSLKAAAKGLTDNLVGTNSEVALFTFGTSAPAAGTANRNRPLTPVSTKAGADLVDSWIDGLSITTAEYTNWDRGMFQVAEQAVPHVGPDNMFDIAIVITDGNPTRYGSGSAATGSPTRYAELEQAIFSANAIKASGTRVVTVGVGPDAPPSAPNLAAISGPVQGSDYYAVGWAQAADTIKQMALAGCHTATTGSLTVLKEVLPAGSTNLDDAVPQGGWQMTTSTATSGVTVDGGTTSTKATAIGTGAAGFDVDFGASPDANIDVDEAISSQPAPHSYYTWYDTECTRLTDGQAVTISGGEQFTVPMLAGDVISCIVYNQLSNSPRSPEMTLQVDMVWVIDGVTYVEGAQPPDFSADVSLNSVGTEDFPNLSSGEVYHNLTTETGGTLSQQVLLPPGCRTTAAAGLQSNNTSDPPEMAGPAIGATGLYSTTANVTIDPGDGTNVGVNKWQITNYITCQANLILAKVINQSAGLQVGTANPKNWDLSVTDPSNNTTTLAYTTTPVCDQTDPDAPCYNNQDFAITNSMTVKPGATYTLAEHGGDAGYTQDLIGVAAGDLVPGATGSWLCWDFDPTTGRFIESLAPNGALGEVTIPYDAPVVECVALNSTAEFSASKQVIGGSATPADWTYSIEAIGAVSPKAPSGTNPAWSQPAQILPGQQYKIVPSQGPAGYILTDILCTWQSPDINGGDPVLHTNESVLANPVLTLAANTTAQCTLVSTFAGSGAQGGMQNQTTLTAPTGGQITAGTLVPMVLAVLMGLAAALVYGRRRMGARIHI